MKDNDKKNKENKELKFLINQLEEAKGYIGTIHSQRAIGILDTLINLLKED